MKLRLLIAAALAISVAGPLAAQSRDQAKPPTPSVPENVPPKGNGDAGPGGSPSGGIDGLPDAETVLDILRRIPKGPRGTLPDPEYDVPDDARPPRPQGGVTVDLAPTRQPRRVVTIPPDRPFMPRPKPRLVGSPPAIVGALVPEVREREVIVTLASGGDAGTVAEVARDFGLDGQSLYSSPLLGLDVARFRISDTRSIDTVLAQLATDARVETVQANYAYIANFAPTIAAGAAAALPVPQYAPDKLRLTEAHKLARGKRIKVAVIDTALDAAHPALTGSITETFDALGETKPVAEKHGTAIAGILGARATMTGVAPDADVLSVRAFATSGTGLASSHSMALLKALDWSVTEGARVVNMSFAGPNDPLFGKAIDAAVSRGVVIVAAAGNGGRDAKPAFPGSHPKVIAVTASDTNDAIFDGANRGAYIAVAAPGVDIITASPNGAYDISSGTSMAAAHVSGIAALMLERNSKLTPDEIRAGLAGSAHQAVNAKAADQGAGIVDAAGALGER